MHGVKNQYIHALCMNWTGWLFSPSSFGLNNRCLNATCNLPVHQVRNCQCMRHLQTTTSESTRKHQECSVVIVLPHPPQQLQLTSFPSGDSYSLPDACLLIQCISVAQKLKFWSCILQQCSQLDTRIGSVYTKLNCFVYCITSFNLFTTLIYPLIYRITKLWSSLICLCNKKQFSVTLTLWLSRGLFRVIKLNKFLYFLVGYFRNGNRQGPPPYSRLEGLSPMKHCLTIMVWDLPVKTCQHVYRPVPLAALQSTWKSTLPFTNGPCPPRSQTGKGHW